MPTTAAPVAMYARTARVASRVFADALPATSSATAPASIPILKTTTAAPVAIYVRLVHRVKKASAVQQARRTAMGFARTCILTPATAVPVDMSVAPRTYNKVVVQTGPV